MAWLALPCCLECTLKYEEVLSSAALSSVLSSHGSVDMYVGPWWKSSDPYNQTGCSLSLALLLLPSKILRCSTYLYLFLNFKFHLNVSLQPVSMANDSVPQVALVAVINAFCAIYLNILDIFYCRGSLWRPLACSDLLRCETCSLLTDCYCHSAPVCSFFKGSVLWNLPGGA